MTASEVEPALPRQPRAAEKKMPPTIKPRDSGWGQKASQSEDAAKETEKVLSLWLCFVVAVPRHLNLSRYIGYSHAIRITTSASYFPLGTSKNLG